VIEKLLDITKEFEEKTTEAANPTETKRSSLLVADGLCEIETVAVGLSVTLAAGVFVTDGELLIVASETILILNELPDEIQPYGRSII
jgi:hypothetical protein